MNGPETNASFTTRKEAEELVQKLYAQNRDLRLILCDVWDNAMGECHDISIIDAVMGAIEDLIDDETGKTHRVSPKSVVSIPNDKPAVEKPKVGQWLNENYRVVGFVEELAIVEFVPGAYHELDHSEYFVRVENNSYLRADGTAGLFGKTMFDTREKAEQFAKTVLDARNKKVDPMPAEIEKSTPRHYTEKKLAKTMLDARSKKADPVSTDIKKSILRYYTEKELTQIEALVNGNADSKESTFLMKAIPKLVAMAHQMFVFKDEVETASRECNILDGTYGRAIRLGSCVCLGCRDEKGAPICDPICPVHGETP